MLYKVNTKSISLVAPSGISLDIAAVLTFVL